MRTVVKAIGTAALGAVVMHLLMQPAFAQQDAEQTAIARCSQELQNQMSREYGGRHPEAIVDARDADVRSVSNGETVVRGGGRYSREESDRGRRFTFDCVYSFRSGNVTRLDYRWTGDERYAAPPPPPPPPPPPRRSGFERPDGPVFFDGGIVNQMSNKALDVQDRSTRDGANVQQWGYGGEPNQRWEMIDVGRGEFAIISVGSGKALEVANSDPRNGANVEQFAWHGGASQRWRLEQHGNVYEVINVGSRKCLDVQDKNPRDGANIQQWDCSGAPNQAWRLQR